jgi:uncharacterized protein
MQKNVALPQFSYPKLTHSQKLSPSKLAAMSRIHCADKRNHFCILGSRHLTSTSLFIAHRELKEMVNRFRAVVLALLLCIATPFAAFAGWDEGLAAYNRQDFKSALREWLPLAQQGNAQAQYSLGVIYAIGQGVPLDYKEAIKWYRLAADQAYAGAQYNLGVMYANGLGVPQEYKEAVKWYRLAADQGYASALFNLGGMYREGHGVTQDYKEAVKWYRLAADQENASALFNLGVMYRDGQGVSQDYKEAVKWLRLAADQGISSAQSSLGLMYHDGKGVTQDYKEAVKWYRLAADQGSTSAQNNLGGMYRDGQSVPKSRVVAFALFNLSAANASYAEEEITTNRTSLAENMSNREIAAAQDLTRELAKPKNLLLALDKYIKKPAVKEAKPVTAPAEPEESGVSASSDGFPERPAKQPGVVSCNTRCENAACWRTYDNGKKVRFQAKQVFDPFTSQFKFDSGMC